MRFMLVSIASLVACGGALMRVAMPSEATQRTPLLDEFEINGTRPAEIEDFVARSQIDSVVLSPKGTRLVVGHMARALRTEMSAPDGKRVALSTLDGLTPQLSVLELPSLQVSKTHQTPVAFFSLADIGWVSESRLLSQWEWPRPGFRVDWDYLGDLHVLDVDRGLNIPMSIDPKGLARTGLPVELRPYVARILSIADGPLRVIDARTNNPDQALIQTTLSRKHGIKYGAFELSTDNGALKRVAALPVGDGKFLTGAGHQVELVKATISQDERVVYYLPPDMRARERADPQASHWLLRVTSNASYGLEPIAWTGKEDEYYALDGRDLPARSVVAWDAEHDTRRVLYSHPTVDMDRVSLDPAGRPWMFSGSDGYPVYWYPDPEHPLALLHQALVQRLPREQIDILNATDDYGLAVARISSARRPPVFALLDVKSVHAMRTFQTYPQLNVSRMAPVDAIEFRADDGVTIHGYFTTPLDSEGNRRHDAPLVVIAHDPQRSAVDYDYDFERQLFAAQGYAVLQVNHRGLRGRGAEFANQANWRGKARDDMEAGVRWAIQQGAAAAGRVCFYGSGHGAGLALEVASRTAGLFHCVVGVNGAYDSKLIDDAAFLEAKVLLMQQRHDPVFPVDPALRLRSALREAGHPPQWEMIGPDDAGFLTPAIRATAYRKIFHFLDQQLGR